ncbi:MAG: PaaI family thioesterase [Ktedonobacterales bacterium]
MDARSLQEQLATLGFQHCWGCGVANEHGLRLQSYWEGDGALAVWQPQPYHIAAPGIVSGGIIATLLDCHGAATACADAYRASGRQITPEGERLVYLTASLEISYLRPTPSDGPLTLRAHVTERGPRRTTVACTLASAAGVETARGVVVCGRPRAL